MDLGCMQNLQISNYILVGFCTRCNVQSFSQDSCRLGKGSEKSSKFWQVILSLAQFKNNTIHLSSFASCIPNLGFLHKDRSTKLPQSGSTQDHQSPQPIRLLTSNPSFPGALPYTCNTNHVAASECSEGEIWNHETSGYIARNPWLSHPKQTTPSDPPGLIICCLDEAGAAPFIASGAQGWIADNLQLSKRLKKHPQKLQIHRSSTEARWKLIYDQTRSFYILYMTT